MDELRPGRKAFLTFLKMIKLLQGKYSVVSRGNLQKASHLYMVFHEYALLPIAKEIDVPRLHIAKVNILKNMQTRPLPRILKIVGNFDKLTGWFQHRNDQAAGSCPGSHAVCKGDANRLQRAPGGIDSKQGFSYGANQHEQRSREVAFEDRDAGACLDEVPE